MDKVLEYRNKVVAALNNELNRYVGGECKGRYFPLVETFDVDEVYELLDRVYDKMEKEDKSSVVENVVRLCEEQGDWKIFKWE